MKGVIFFYFNAIYIVNTGISYMEISSIQYITVKKISVLICPVAEESFNPILYLKINTECLW